MAEATRRLSSACRLNPSNSSSSASASNGSNNNSTRAGRIIRERRTTPYLIVKERQESIGDEMTSVLSMLGEVLEEVADAQISMCQSLDAPRYIIVRSICGCGTKQGHTVTQRDGCYGHE